MSCCSVLICIFILVCVCVQRTRNYLQMFHDFLYSEYGERCSDCCLEQQTWFSHTISPLISNELEKNRFPSQISFEDHTNSHFFLISITIRNSLFSLLKHFCAVCCNALNTASYGIGIVWCSSIFLVHCLQRRFRRCFVCCLFFFFLISYHFARKPERKMAIILLVDRKKWI